MSQPPLSPVEAAAVERDVRAVIERTIVALNEAWTTRSVAPDSVLRDVTADFSAVQYAPWYDGGRWEGGRDEWISGTEEAAASGGPGHRWELEVIRVAARSRDEAVAAYVVRLSWPDPQLAPAMAIFLETWIHPGERWLLSRHTSEKA